MSLILGSGYLFRQRTNQDLKCVVVQELREYFKPITLEDATLSLLTATCVISYVMKTSSFRITSDKMPSFVFPKADPITLSTPCTLVLHKMGLAPPNSFGVKDLDHVSLYHHMQQREESAFLVAFGQTWQEDIDVSTFHNMLPRTNVSAITLALGHYCWGLQIHLSLHIYDFQLAEKMFPIPFNATTIVAALRLSLFFEDYIYYYPPGYLSQISSSFIVTYLKSRSSDKEMYLFLFSVSTVCLKDFIELNVSITTEPGSLDTKPSFLYTLWLQMNPTKSVILPIFYPHKKGSKTAFVHKVSLNIDRWVHDSMLACAQMDECQLNLKLYEKLEHERYIAKMLKSHPL